MHLINHADIRNELVKNLHEFMGCLVVQQSTTGDKPEYPFITYAVTSPYLKKGKPEQYYRMIENEAKEVQVEHYEQVYSFTVAATDEDEAMDLCLRARKFFVLHGVEQLKEKGIVIVSIDNVSARDNFITVNYERRYGFDVRIRLMDEETSAIDIIESAKMIRKN